ncbi:CaiB/BaiF CoA transferase family protein [Chloroflexota bacterium]
MLSCYRVLDLTNDKGFICGKALGDLGADVIKIEKPGGDPSRSTGPFFHDIPDPEKSLYWFAFNANKRGITLDIETSDGREIFKNLVKTADVVIESFPVGHMDKIGLGYQALSEVNPGVIMTSISGFGQEGPYKDYNDHEIAVWALSGFMYISGEADRPPLAPSYHHSHLVGAMNGAVGTMVALSHRELTGRGQQVDASSHQSLCFATSVQTKVPWSMEGKIMSRNGRNRSTISAKDGVINIPLVWECKDGYIVFEIWFGNSYRASNAAIVAWMKEDGKNLGVLEKFNWDTQDWPHYTRQETEEVRDILSNFFSKHTKNELYEGALERRIMITPLLTPGEQLEFPQLVERDFWVDVEHPELGTKITYPGAFAKPGLGVCGIRFRAPLIGEHNDEIYGKEFGMSTKELVGLKQRQVI